MAEGMKHLRGGVFKQTYVTLHTGQDGGRTDSMLGGCGRPLVRRCPRAL